MANSKELLKQPYITIPLLLLSVVLYRLWHILQGRFPLDSDEGIIGLLMIRALRGNFSVFFPGQDYLGTFLYMLFSPLLLVFGENPFGLRMVYLTLLLLILLIWRKILTYLNALEIWPFLVLLCASGPVFFLEWTTKARGMVEVLFMGSLWLFCLLYLLRNSDQFERRKWQLLGFGTLTAVAWWTSQLVLFFFIPGAIYILCFPETRTRLRDLFFSKTFFLLFAAAFMMTALVYLRATLYFQSPVQDVFWENRFVILTLWLLSLVSCNLYSHFASQIRWPVQFLNGLNLGYLPVILRVWGKQELYNTTSLQSLENVPVNLSAFIFLAFPEIVLGRNQDDLSLKLMMMLIAWYVLLSIGLLFFLKILGQMAYRYWKGDTSQETPYFRTSDFFLLIFSSVTFLLLMFVTRVGSPAPHYAVTPIFFLNLLLAGFLWKVWKLDKITASIFTILLLTINLLSAPSLPKHDLHPFTGIAREEAEIIEFLEEIGCDEAQGYLMARPMPEDEVRPWLASAGNAPWSVAVGQPQEGEPIVQGELESGAGGKRAVGKRSSGGNH